MTVRAFVRALLYVVPTLVLGIALWVAWRVLFVGDVLEQAECDRGDCSAIGDFTWDARWLILVVCVFVAGLVVWSVGRLLRRPVRG